MLDFLEKEGYKGHTHDKNSGICGLGIFYKAAKFDLVEKKVIDFDAEGRSFILSCRLRWK